MYLCTYLLSYLLTSAYLLADNTELTNLQTYTAIFYWEGDFNDEHTNLQTYWGLFFRPDDRTYKLTNLRGHIFPARRPF